MAERDVTPELKVEHEMHHRRAGRNWGVFAALAAMIVLIFAVSLVKLGPEGVKNPSANAGSWSKSLAEWLSK